MLKLLFFSAVLQYAAALYDCPAFVGPMDPSCPLTEDIEGVGRVCYSLVNAYLGSAFTYNSGDKKCKDLFGEKSHLANVYNKKCFLDVRCYVIEETDPYGVLDKKVLLGMHYDSLDGVTRLYGGETLPHSYWGEKSRPLSYGTNMILRAHEHVVRSKLYNFGGSSERYDRILCQYPKEK